MKTLYLSLACAAFVSQSMAQSEKGRQAVDLVSERISSRDIHGLISMLPGLEPLWKEDRGSYFKALRSDVEALVSSKDPEGIKAALATAPQVMEKRSPAGTDDAIVYVVSKWKIIESYFNTESFRGNPDRLLEVATFLGEVRSLRIADYQNQGSNLPGRDILTRAGVQDVSELKTKADRDAYEAAVKKNEEDLKMNELQTRLSSADFGLTNMLATFARQTVPVGKAENQAFYKELVKRAKLTEQEVKVMNQP